MAVSETGQILAAIKAQTGMTWPQIAGTIGASSGDYVRKVASGAKPGDNLTSAVAQLWQTGRVEAPVPRRRTKAGTIARVRAPASAPAPSRRPSETRITAGKDRQMFRGASGKLGWAQGVGTDPATFRAAVTAAGRGGRRVTIRARVRGADGRYRWVTLGSKGGYRPRDIPRGVDPASWAISQGSFALAGYGIHAATEDDVDDIEVIAE